MILKDHAHWVTTLALNTDFVLRTGPFDHTAKRPASDEEGLLSQYLADESQTHCFLPSSITCIKKI